jgi:hypothetical protein
MQTKYSFPEATLFILIHQQGFWAPPVFSEALIEWLANGVFGDSPWSTGESGTSRLSALRCIISGVLCILRARSSHEANPLQ